MTTVIRSDGFVPKRRRLDTLAGREYETLASNPVSHFVPSMSMSTNTNSVGIVRESAHTLVSLGYHLVPCEPGGKRPLLCWAGSPSGHAEVDRWLDGFGAHINLAIHAGKSGVVVLDADTPEAAAWIETHCPATPMAARTPRGGRHAYFRSPDHAPPPAQNLFGIGLDLKAGNSLVLASPSLSLAYRRRWEWIGRWSRPRCFRPSTRCSFAASPSASPFPRRPAAWPGHHRADASAT